MRRWGLWRTPDARRPGVAGSGAMDVETTAADRPPDRPATRRRTLRPGVVAVRRGDDRLQVGTDASARVLLPDTPQVRDHLSALRRLAVGAEGAAGVEVGVEVGAVLHRLEAAGLVVDADALLDELGAARRAGGRAASAGAAPLGGTTLEGAVSSLFAADPSTAHERLQRRRDAAVEVVGPAPWRDAARTLLAASLVGTVAEDETAGATGARSPARGARAGRRADRPRRSGVSLVVSVGEPSRALVDDLVRDEVAHLLVALLPDRVRVGPLVEVGRTACLRCVDATLGELDPRHALVVAQLVDAPAALVAEPVDPALATLALAWAVREVASYVEGDRPTTWSTTLELDGTGLPRPTRWERHPWCGCSWDEAT